MRSKVGEKASAADVAALSAEVARLKKAEVKPAQSQRATIYEDDVDVESPDPESDILVTVVHKEVGRDKKICDEVKIPVKDFLSFGKSERVLDLKKKNKSVGTLYLWLTSAKEWS